MLKKVLEFSLIKKVLKFVKTHKRLSFVILLISALIINFLLPKNKIVIQTEQAKVGDLIKSISITGSIESRSQANLSFQTGGTIVYLGAKEGDSVKKGQAIVFLDKQKLEASFRQAQQDFTAAKAASEQYYSSHTNATESYDEKVKRTALDASQNKAYDQMVKAEKDLTDSTLYAPFDGILIREDVDTIGVNITPATVFTIVDPSSLDFKMDIDEADIGNVKIGLVVSIILDSYPNETIEEKVTSMDFATHSTTTGGNAYTIKTNLLSDNSDYKYRIGMNGNAEIILNKAVNVVHIPLSSIFDNNSVYVKVGGRYEKRILALGLENDTDVEVKSGVKPNEEIVLDPTLVKPQKGLFFSR